VDERRNSRSSPPIELEGEELAKLEGEDISVADEEVQTEGEVISLSSPTAVSAESGITMTPFSGE